MITQELPPPLSEKAACFGERKNAAYDYPRIATTAEKAPGKGDVFRRAEKRSSGDEACLSLLHFYDNQASGPVSIRTTNVNAAQEA